VADGFSIQVQFGRQELASAAVLWPWIQAAVSYSHLDPPTPLGKSPADAGSIGSCAIEKLGVSLLIRSSKEGRERTTGEPLNAWWI
jgi:hypothetical protein